MNSLTLNKPWSRTSAWARALTLAALAAGEWALSTTQANARDVHFSVGVHAPGVSLGVSNGGYGYHRPPVYYSPPPVYYAPPPVYYAPPPVYRGVRPVVVTPPPIYYERPSNRRHWDERRHRHDRDDRRRHGHRDDHRYGHGYR